MPNEMLADVPCPLGEQDLYLLRRELIRDEGVRNKPYRDTVGVLTVGVGWNMEANPFPPHILKLLQPDWRKYGMPDLVIDRLLDISIGKAMKELDRIFPFWRELDPVRQRVLINMCFNLGGTGLSKFRATLGYIEKRDFLNAARQMLRSKWAFQVGQRAKRLAGMMNEGRVGGKLP